MSYLLDTHVLLWWWSEPERLSPRVLSLMKDPENRCFISAASAWEIATKHRIGKYPAGGRVMNEWSMRIRADRFQELAISSIHALRAGSLPGAHRDPFDKMLAAQGSLEDLTVLSTDPAISGLGAARVWE
ncbi:MAG TPA: type II toxin-antitoxin system VapC family toxin [Spirochaetia bacterium]|nr:type II toxin-antitoxin system VapC family toxin [Spirochaetia bacterium]